MSGDPCPSLVVCVLGLSREKGEHFSRQRGIGKSCLCYRFMHPGHDDYIDEHSSLLALHEFENPVLNSVHFLYWGSTTKRFPIHGGPKEQRIQFHVIEQTVFYQDVTSQPFKILTKPDSLENYIRRATSHNIESPGKISYKSRDTISLRQEYVWQPYPSGISRLPRGFIVVIDVSQNGAEFNRQIARAERIMEYLLKHKRRFVIIATKRDVFNPASMNTVQYLKKKYGTQIFAASASVNINVSDAFHFIALKVLQKEVRGGLFKVSDAFRFIAFKVLKKEVRGVSDYIPTYEQARHQLLDQKVTSRQIFRNFLKKRVVNSDERVNALENMEEYRDCVHVVGKFETDMLFADHLIEVYSKKLKSFAVVPEKPQLLLGFLEDFVDQRMDLAQYSERLRRWIRSYVEEHPVVLSEEEGSLGMKRSEVASVSPIAKEVNQGHHVLHNPSNSFFPDRTTGIPVSECSAYGVIDQGCGKLEETNMYEETDLGDGKLEEANMYEETDLGDAKLEEANMYEETDLGDAKKLEEANIYEETDLGDAKKLEEANMYEETDLGDAKKLEEANIYEETDLGDAKKLEEADMYEDIDQGDAQKLEEANMYEDIDLGDAKKLEEADMYEDIELGDAKKLEEANMYEETDLGDAKKLEEANMNEETDLGDAKKLEEADMYEDIELGDAKKLEEANMYEETDLGDAKKFEEVDMYEDIELGDAKKLEKANMYEDIDLGDAKKLEKADMYEETDLGDAKKLEEANMYEEIDLVDAKWEEAHIYEFLQ